MIKKEIMTRKKMSKLLMSTLYIESQLKCILKEILPKNIEKLLNNPFSKRTKHILNIRNKKLSLKIVKKSFSLHKNNINDYSINGIINWIYIANFIKLVSKKYNYPSKQNIKFVINNLQTICSIRNKLAHPKCFFNISEQELIKTIYPLKLKNNLNYQQLINKLYIVEKILNKILKK